MGYHQAGFDVVGFDIKPQKRYPFEHRVRDVLTITPKELRAEFDAIHASPPCQFGTAMRTMHNAKEHANLIPATRALLRASGLPYIIENVQGAMSHLIDPILLCGTMFGLGVEDAELQRHRGFELSFPILLVPQCQHGDRDVLGVYGGHVRNRRRIRTMGIYGEGVRDSRRRKFDKGVPDFSIDQGRAAMGCDWMTTAELSQAIPPAYTKWLGDHLMQHLTTHKAAA
jgi:DNA (cytosine-5)-methyltransferase 1